MLIDFNELKELLVSNSSKDTENVYAKMCMIDTGKVLVRRLEEGAHIKTHTHKTSYEVDYVLRGEGITFLNDSVELLKPGSCHYCPIGSSHSIHNTGTKELVLFTIVIGKQETINNRTI